MPLESGRMGGIKLACVHADINPLLSTISHIWVRGFYLVFDRLCMGLCNVTM